MMKQSQDVLMWFDNMKSLVPSWYLEDFYIQYNDGQDSGNPKDKS